jgi:hypothetical protein
MPEPKSPLKVFLCHTSADKPKVRELYRYLRKRRIKPWFDEMDLVGGQDWQVEIPKALFNSDAILVCLTKNAVDKEGYIQKEIKFALDKALEMPEGRIFLIPVRFEECEVPFALSRYQWVDLFDEAGYTRMMRALMFRADQLERASVEVQRNGRAEEKPQEENLGYEKLEATSENEVATPLLPKKAVEDQLERTSVEIQRNDRAEEKPQEENSGYEKLETISENEVATPVLPKKTVKEYIADNVAKPQFISNSPQENTRKESLFFPRLIKHFQLYWRILSGLLLIESGVLMLLQTMGYIASDFGLAILIWLSTTIIFFSFTMSFSNNDKK